jgi:hypothetical protein
MKSGMRISKLMLVLCVLLVACHKSEIELEWVNLIEGFKNQIPIFKFQD